MDVGLRYVGQLVVHHRRQLVDIDAPGGDVGGHQHPDSPALEALQGLDAGGLALVAVDGHGGNAGPAQLLHHPVRAVLGIGEDQDAVQRVVLQHLLEEELLVALVYLVEALFDGVHRGGLGSHLHPDGIFQDGAGQVRDLLGHGGGEEEGLPLFRQAGDDLPHVVDEAHVQHPIRLVEDEGIDAGEVNMALAAQIVEPTGGGYQDVHTLLQGLHLGGLAHAAEDDGVAQLQVFAVLVEALLDL